ncbi:hypothetical protein EIP91_008832 [Steccherinum ochraceum]|uniref:Uncharacterized protein n=1 Tax=Steccherinum ochraceum TaxID=92696 RepID=A0A4R0R2A4_9APHY|nr:hypothetical protein EIP91_008832 [Steccherinum ochraceum]
MSHPCGHNPVDHSPSTEFSTAINADGSAHIPSIDWGRMASQEPSNAILWLTFLHNNNRFEAEDLVHAILGTLREHGDDLSQWSMYDRAHLPCTLMDILSSEGMFSEDMKAFKNLTYGNALLDLLAGFLGVMSNNTNKVESHDRDIFPHLFDKLEAFCVAMWRRRHLIPNQLDSPADDSDENFHSRLFGVSVVRVAVRLVQLYRFINRPERSPPISSFAAHMLFHCWMFIPDDEDLWREIPKHIVLIVARDNDNIAGFIRDIFLSPKENPDYPRRFLKRFSRRLRDEDNLGHEAFNLLAMGAFLIGRSPDTIRKVRLPAGQGVFSAVVTCALRQMCSTPSNVSRIAVGQAVRAIVALLNNGTSQPDVADDFLLCCSNLNVVSMAAFALVHAVGQEDSEDCDAAISLLHLKVMIMEMRRSPEKYRISARIWRFATSEWQAKLNDIRAIQTRNPAQRQRAFTVFTGGAFDAERQAVLADEAMLLGTMRLSFRGQSSAASTSQTGLQDTVTYAKMSGYEALPADVHATDRPSSSITFGTVVDKKGPYMITRSRTGQSRRRRGTMPPQAKLPKFNRNMKRPDAAAIQSLMEAMTSKGSPQPRTRFGSLGVGGSGNCTIQWEQVVAQEPQNVVAWIQHLHQRQHPEAWQLMGHVFSILNSWSRPPQWHAFSETLLPCVLMDIVTDPAMFTPQRVTFKSLMYGIEILRVINLSVSMILHAINDKLDKADTRCAAGILSKLGSFSEALWKKRDLMPTVVPSQSAASEPPANERTRFAADVFRGISYVLQLHNQFLQRWPSLELHTLDLFLYGWVYNTDFRSSKSVIYYSNEMLTGDLTVIGKFVKRHLQSCHAEYATHLVKKMLLLFRDDRVLDGMAHRLSYLYMVFLHEQKDIIGAITFKYPEGAIHSNLNPVPSLIIFCLRQMCSSDLEWSHRCVFMTIENIVAILNVHSSRESTVEDLCTFTGHFNLIAIISTSLIWAVEDNDIKSVFIYRLSSPTDFTGIVLQIIGNIPQDVQKHPEYLGSIAVLTRVSVQIWHDTIASIRAVSPKDSTHEMAKKMAIERWQEYGAIFKLKEGVDVTTMKKLSEPSEHKRYWKIPKQDWEAGHRDVCGTLRIGY